jgi:hypothetical protein
MYRPAIVFSLTVLLMAAFPAAAQSVPDLDGGDWSWSSVERLRLPEDFVLAMGPLLGIVPEGENTHALCESAGSMTLVQTGTTFEGTAVKEFNSCETTGGQIFQQPSVNFFVVDGRIRGNSVYFSFESATVKPCPHQVVITETDGDSVVGLSGTGRCILPGHPQSESPVSLDPPPGGTSKTLNWEASRP